MKEVKLLTAADVKARAGKDVSLNQKHPAGLGVSDFYLSLRKTKFRSMGKIFTIEFQCVNKMHKALVSVCNRSSKPLYHIQLIDERLQEVFATEHIRYRGEEGYRHLDFYKYPFTREMLKRMAAAIERNLSSQYAIIKWLFPAF